jgi:act minimal PKS chain-length factor (CLF/KS beta)
MSDAVAITGVGVVCALGIGVEAFWEALAGGRGGCRPASRVDAPGLLVAEVDGLEPRRFAFSAQARRIDRTSLLAVAAAQLALADAGLTRAQLVPASTAVGLGSAFGNVEETALFLDRVFERGAGNPMLFPNLVMNAPLSYACIEFGVTGPTAMVTEQEASGEGAIAWGARQIADGTAEVCLAGGSDELTSGLVRLRRETGTIGSGAPRPLDLHADGACLGEGAAVLLLEGLAHARVRGARVYAELVPHEGAGIPAPVHGWPVDGDALGRVLAPLVADADLVVAAASGSPPLDTVEADALAGAFGDRRVAVTAPRGATGDFGSAGALAVATAALAIRDGIVPPTLGCRPPARRGLDVVTGTARRIPVRVAVVDGLARGGMCCPVRLEAT